MARVGLDLDGCLYDFCGSLRHYLVSTCKIDEAKCVEYQRWEFYEDWGLTLEQFIEACHLGVDEGIVFSWGNPLPGSNELVERLVENNHSIHIITDRSFGSSPLNSELNTLTWLRKHKLYYDSITFTRDKTSVETDVMLEDKLSNYDALVKAGCDAWLLNRPWNQSNGIIRNRVNSLEEFGDRVDEHTFL